MDGKHERDALQQMQEWVQELVSTCQDMGLLDLIYKMLVMR